MVRDGISDKVTFEQKPKGNEKQHHLNRCDEKIAMQKKVKKSEALTYATWRCGTCICLHSLKEQTPKLRMWHKN